MTIQRTSHDISVIKNRDFITYIYLRDANNDPINITTWTGVAQIRQSDKPDSPLLATIIVSVVDGLLGKLKLFMALADTTDICDATGHWDLVLTNSDAITDTYLYGDVTFEVAPTVIAAG